LAQVGGAGGDESGPATWTYDIEDPATGQTLASAVDPTDAPHRWRRPAVGAMSAATFGYAHRDASGGGGSLALGWINETPVQEACGPGGGGGGGGGAFALSAPLPNISPEADCGCGKKKGAP